MYWMIENQIRDFFGWSATGLTICFYIFPVIPFIKLLKGKITYEETPAIIVTTSFVNCFCWYIYGKLISSHQIKLCNFIGALSSLILIMIYLRYELKKFLIDAILNALILMSGSYAVYIGFTDIIEDKSVIGKICIVTSCVIFLSPITIIYKVTKEKNYNLIPIYKAYISVASTFCWIVYGILITDGNVIFPNVIGIILAIIQIIIFFRIKKIFSILGEKENTATIGIESNENEKDDKASLKNKKEEKEEKDENTVIKLDEDNQNNNKEKPVKIVSNVDN